MYIETETIKTGVVSVLHLSLDEREILEDTPPGHLPWFIYKNEYCYCLSTQYQALPKFLSEETKKVLDYAALELGLDRVEFDVDGMLLPGFKQYDE